MVEAMPFLKLTTLFAIIASLIFRPDLNSLLAPSLIPNSRHLLHASRIIPLHSATGPESIAFDPNGGGPYTGVADGRILKWEGEISGWVDFATTSPRRQSIDFTCASSSSAAAVGLLGPEGGLATPLVTEVEGKSLYFTNDMDIDEQDNVIYFTDSSTDFHRRDFMGSVFTGDKTGRLLKYEKTSKEVTILLRNLSFANGVSLSNDSSFVLGAETSARKILKLWIRGPESGKVGVFCELLGFPDNIRRNQKGEFWVALHAKDGLVPKFIISHPFVGNLLLKLPLGFKRVHSLLVGAKPQATILKVDRNGEVLEVLEDIDGRSVKFISEVEEKDGKLWLGSVMVPFVGVYDL